MSTVFMRAYAAATAARVPVLITGDPGEAKTAKLSALAEHWGRHVEVVIGSIRDSQDFLGLPYEVVGESGHEVAYAPPGWANRLSEAEASTLILDEFNLARKTVMDAMLRVVEEGYVGERRLPETTTITAIMNPPESSAFGDELTPPVANRFLHLEWFFDADEWLDNVLTGFAHASYPALGDLLTNETREAATARAGALVTGFLRTRRDALRPGPPSDPSEAGKAWASPRTWTKLISVLSFLSPGDEEAMNMVATGLVGQRWATEFMAWARAADLGDPYAVIDDPSIFDWGQSRTDRVFAMLSSVASVGAQAASDGTPEGKDLWRSALLTCKAAADAGRTDVGIPAVRLLWNARPKGVKSIPKSVGVAYSDLFIATGKAKAA